MVRQITEYISSMINHSSTPPTSSLSNLVISVTFTTVSKFSTFCSNSSLIPASIMPSVNILHFSLILSPGINGATVFETTASSTNIFPSTNSIVTFVYHGLSLSNSGSPTQLVFSTSSQITSRLRFASLY